MQKISAVILAAGKGTRFLPLTVTTPKPLIKVAGKPAIEYNMEAMAPFVDQFIIVVGYLKEKFISHFGDSFLGVPITFIEQKEQKGTADALIAAQSSIKNESFFLIYGDDLYDPDFFKLLSEKQDAAIGQKEDNWKNFGIFQLKEGSTLEKIVEKPEIYIGNLANIGVYRFNKTIFEYVSHVQESIRGEYEVTDLVSAYCQKNPVEIIEAIQGWIPLSYPWHILDATEYLLKKMSTKIDGQIEAGATIHGNVILGKNSIIKAGSYLEGNFFIGENTIIGPNCSLRKFAAIGNDCAIGTATEITSSVIGDGVMMKHLAYVGNSIVGNNVNIAGGVVVANLRHDHQTIKVRINDSLVDTGKDKFGTIIGDKAKIGINTSIYPGRKIYNDVWTFPGDIIKEDKLK